MHSQNPLRRRARWRVSLSSRHMTMEVGHGQHSHQGCRKGCVLLAGAAVLLTDLKPARGPGPQELSVRFVEIVAPLPLPATGSTQSGPWNVGVRWNGER